MKHILFLCFLLILLIPLISACHKRTSSTTMQNTKTSDICFTDTLHNFGTIPLSQPIDSFDFKFTNCGQKKLVILGVEVSCRCTKVYYSHAPIEPDKESFIRVIYDARGHQPEFFNKSIKVISNAKKDIVTLKISGNLQ